VNKVKENFAITGPVPGFDYKSLLSTDQYARDAVDTVARRTVDSLETGSVCTLVSRRCCVRNYS